MIGSHQKHNFDSPWIIPFMPLFFLLHAKSFSGAPTLRTNNLALPFPLHPLPAVGALPPFFFSGSAFYLSCFFLSLSPPPSSLFLIVYKFAFLSWLLIFFSCWVHYFPIFPHLKSLSPFFFSFCRISSFSSVFLPCTKN